MSSGSIAGGTDAWLRVDGLSVNLASGDPVVDNVDLRLERGQILGVVGESGSGKTTTALAMLGYAQPGLSIVGGRVSIRGRELLKATPAELRRLRGRLIAYVPQDPSTALNPSQRVEVAVGEMLRATTAARERAVAVEDVLGRAKLPATREFRRRYPHQLSGGQQQRLAIAMAWAANPAVVVLDEPTTGLDVMTEQHILTEVRRLRDETAVAMVYVTHDLSVVASIADRVAVMYAGSIIEEGPVAGILRAPRHPYTRGLVAAVPDLAVRRRLVGIPGRPPAPRDRLTGCTFAPRCNQLTERCTEHQPELCDIEGGGRRVRCFEWPATPPLHAERSDPVAVPVGAGPLLEVEGLRAVHTSRSSQIVAAESVSFNLHPGSCVALVGESGSGKTTIARCIAGLHPPSGGMMLLDGAPLAPLARDRSREECRRIQIVFQNPTDSLNPRRTVGDAIARPARLLRGLSRQAAELRVESLLDQVRLSPGLARRHPSALSGGERQRVAIARALAAEPSLIICDEITSALDVSVQAAILELLSDLRQELGLSLLFISHDLGVVSSVADEVVVLKDGVVREHRTTGSLIESPTDAYTRALLDAVPRLTPSGETSP